ncbi:nitrite reductase small subunit NirD [Maribrevibacterium harenarium]|uniref:Nitrite reductase small subunit NirD n=1 Tax=Maribrevibacterium harenarium TaxID=2589817 RepID=A0A501WYW4_9GAMM|nr:nitrite reductase small subunit NirD [Maribrevibacterium harenarium]TPE52797.1 nitrite reductase small subunit NirD [Maribrevibacterium harenarium]
MNFTYVCDISDLDLDVGAAALINGQQIALFKVANNRVFAISNWDPIGKANVLSRGIVGDLDGDFVVASPLYKQHFSLSTGKCLEEDVSVQVWQSKVESSKVFVAVE